MTEGPENIVWHKHSVTRKDRQRVMRQKACVMWFTGLSGSGKSTLAGTLEKRLNEAGRITYLLDGDNVRCGLNADLGFSQEDRHESNRRVSYVAHLFYDANVITLVSFISPFRAERRQVRELIGTDFLEIFVDTPLEVCERRDPKGFYKKARAGEISEFTGISSPYETPERPELTLHPASDSIETCVEQLLGLMRARRYL